MTVIVMEECAMLLSLTLLLTQNQPKRNRSSNKKTRGPVRYTPAKLARTQPLIDGGGLAGLVPLSSKYLVGP